MTKTCLVVGALVVALLGFLVVRTDTRRSQDALVPQISFSHAHGIAVDGADATKVYIATHEGLYFLKEEQLFRVGNTQDDLMGFSAHPTLTNVFFSSGHSSTEGNRGFKKTTDGGLTWNQVSEGLGGPVDFHAMTVSRAEPARVYGFYDGKLQRSDDEGVSWEYAKGTVTPFSLSTHPVEKDVVYAATGDGVLVSADKGDTWQSLSGELEGGAVSVFVISPTDPTLALVFSQQLGGLGKSTDGGKTWKKIPSVFGNETVLYLAYSTSLPGTVYALTETNSLFKSSNAGDAWENVR